MARAPSHASRKRRAISPTQPPQLAASFAASSASSAVAAAEDLAVDQLNPRVKLARFHDADAAHANGRVEWLQQDSSSSSSSSHTAAASSSHAAAAPAPSSFLFAPPADASVSASSLLANIAAPAQLPGAHDRVNLKRLGESLSDVHEDARPGKRGHVEEDHDDARENQRRERIRRAGGGNANGTRSHVEAAAQEEKEEHALHPPPPLREANRMLALVHEERVARRRKFEQQQQQQQEQAQQLQLQRDATDSHEANGASLSAASMAPHTPPSSRRLRRSVSDERMSNSPAIAAAAAATAQIDEPPVPSPSHVLRGFVFRSNQSSMQQSPPRSPASSSSSLLHTPSSATPARTPSMNRLPMSPLLRFQLPPSRMQAPSASASVSSSLHTGLADTRPAHVPWWQRLHSETPALAASAAPVRHLPFAPSVLAGGDSEGSWASAPGVPPAAAPAPTASPSHMEDEHAGSVRSGGRLFATSAWVPQPQRSQLAQLMQRQQQQQHTTAMQQRPHHSAFSFGSMHAPPAAGVPIAVPLFSSSSHVTQHPMAHRALPHLPQPQPLQPLPAHLPASHAPMMTTRMQQHFATAAAAASTAAFDDAAAAPKRQLSTGGSMHD